MCKYIQHLLLGERCKVYLNFLTYVRGKVLKSLKYKKKKKKKKKNYLVLSYEKSNTNSKIYNNDNSIPFTGMGNWQYI